MYGSTEGTVGMINTEDKIGAVGFVFQWIPVVPYRLIKLDKNGDPARDKKTGKKNIWEFLFCEKKINFNKYGK